MLNLQLESYSSIDIHATRLYEDSIVNYVGLVRNPIPISQEAINLSKQFVLPYCLIGMIYSFGLTDESIERSEELFKQVEQLGVTRFTDHEKLHVQAWHHWLKNDSQETIKTYRHILRDYPTDILALKLVTDIYYFVGNYDHMLDTTTTFVNNFDPSSTSILYGFGLGIHSFALEETRRYSKALYIAQKAISINPNDVWAIHTMAHIYEMKGEWEEGISFLERTEEWQNSELMAIHIWWHKALFYLHAGKYEDCYKIYHNHIKKPNPSTMDLIDASSLLWRLNLLDKPVSDTEWENVAKRWKKLLNNHSPYLNLAHAFMALSSVNIDSTDRFSHDLLDNRSNEDGVNLCKSIIEYSKENYIGVIQTMPDYASIQNFGGSNAQRDIFCLTRISAAKKMYEKLKGLREEKIKLNKDS